MSSPTTNGVALYLTINIRTIMIMLSVAVYIFPDANKVQNWVHCPNKAKWKAKENTHSVGNPAV